MIVGRVGLSKAQTKQRILAVAKALPVAARKLQSAPEQGFSGNAVVERINALIAERCALTIRRLTHPAVESAMTATEHP
jgi:serine/threonine-protein kinase HipA